MLLCTSTAHALLKIRWHGMLRIFRSTLGRNAVHDVCSTFGIASKLCAVLRIPNSTIVHVVLELLSTTKIRGIRAIRIRVHSHKRCFHQLFGKTCSHVVLFPVHTTYRKRKRQGEQQSTSPERWSPIDLRSVEIRWQVLPHALQAYACTIPEIQTHTPSQQKQR